MPENNLTVENNNSNNEEVRFLTDEDFLKVPGIYFDTASTLLRRFTPSNDNSKQISAQYFEVCASEIWRKWLNLAFAKFSLDFKI